MNEELNLKPWSALEYIKDDEALQAYVEAWIEFKKTEEATQQYEYDWSIQDHWK